MLDGEKLIAYIARKLESENIRVCDNSIIMYLLGMDTKELADLLENKPQT